MRVLVLVLGAGFGGPELTTRLSEELGDAVEVVLLDQGEGFVFGFSELDVMFGRRSADSVLHRSEIALVMPLPSPIPPSPRGRQRSWRTGSSPRSGAARPAGTTAAASATWRWVAQDW